ncbi:thioredoxin family protein [Paenibacillus arenosi]|uniref:Thioredoxin family protein n=1 Tax=Paenibacillus arenosi TaxID=2774142 RepID=A0ABR9AYZ2_9BACL|nr:thioredoxin family protein [Paenibacillus arenosi]
MKPLTIQLFYSRNCSYCRLLSKTIDEIAQERPHLQVKKIMHDPQTHVKIKYLPTIVVSYKNDELGRFSSAVGRRELDNWFDKLETYVGKYL